MGRKKMAKGLTVKVRCGSEFKATHGRSLHTIVLSSNGKLHLADHTPEEIAAESVMGALGGEQVRCLEVLKSWVAWIQEPHDRRAVLNPNLPKLLQGPCHLARIEHLKRKDIRYRTRIAEHPSLGERCAKLTFKMLSNALSRCGYRRSYGHNEYVQVWQARDTYASAGNYGHSRVSNFDLVTGELPVCEGGKDRKYGSWWKVHVRSSWLTDVYMQGISVVEAHLTLQAQRYKGEVASTVKLAWEVVRAAQGKWYSLKKESGFIAQDFNGNQAWGTTLKGATMRLGRMRHERNRETHGSEVQSV